MLGTASPDTDPCWSLSLATKAAKKESIGGGVSHGPHAVAVVARIIQVRGCTWNSVKHSWILEAFAPADATNHRPDASMVIRDLSVHRQDASADRPVHHLDKAFCCKTSRPCRAEKGSLSEICSQGLELTR